jgi:hypothetical protein
MGGLMAAFCLVAMPIEARAISPDEPFQKVIPKVERGERKPAKRRTHRPAPAAPEAKAPGDASAERGSVVAAPVPVPRPSGAASTTAVVAPVPQTPASPRVPDVPVPRSKPAAERKAAGLVAIPKPADVAVETVATERVPPDPSLAAGAATALAGSATADPATGEQLAFAPPVLPSRLQMASPLPGQQSPNGSLRKADRLPPSGAEAAIADDGGAGPTDAAPSPSLPLPRPKPDIVLAALVPATPPVVPEGLAACRAAMAALKIAAKPLPAIHAGSCGGPDPFDVTELEGGAIALSPAAKVNCAVATTLARWIAEDIQPSAASLLGGRVTGLRIADSYSCRGRNRVAQAKLSEHAFLNAVDIGAFEINDRWITVNKAKDRTAKEGEFLKAARATACDKFQTVLGPGSDGYHEDHYHLDLRRRGKGGGSKYCR